MRHRPALYAGSRIIASPGIFQLPSTLPECTFSLQPPAEEEMGKNNARLHTMPFDTCFEEDGQEEARGHIRG